MTAAADGTFELHARDASLSGRSLRFQPDEHGAVGHWHYPEDKATWTIDVPQAGKYDVEFDWAIDDGAGGCLWIELSGQGSWHGRMVDL